MRSVPRTVAMTVFSISFMGLPGGSAVVAAPAAPPVAIVDLALAEALTQRCLLQYHDVSWPPFSVVVVDAAGAPVLLRRQDGAAPVTADVALLKARTTARFGAPTQLLASMAQDAPTRDLLLLLQLTDDPGGVPLKVGGRLIGAIGVSGGSVEQDVGCATVAANLLSAEKK